MNETTQLPSEASTVAALKKTNRKRKLPLGEKGVRMNISLSREEWEALTKTARAVRVSKSRLLVDSALGRGMRHYNRLEELAKKANLDPNTYFDTVLTYLEQKNFAVKITFIEGVDPP